MDTGTLEKQEIVKFSSLLGMMIQVTNLPNGYMHIDLSQIAYYILCPSHAPRYKEIS